jgi:hypothetical protein
MSHKWWPVSPGIERCSQCFMMRKQILDGRTRREEHSTDYGKTWTHLRRSEIPACPMQKEAKDGKARSNRGVP